MSASAIPGYEDWPAHASSTPPFAATDASAQALADVLGLDIGGDTMSVNFGGVGEQYVGYALEGRVRGLHPVTKGKIHLAFEVAWDDIERAKEELDRRGIPNAGPITFPHAFHGPPGSRAVYFEDPDGNQLELWARPVGEG